MKTVVIHGVRDLRIEAREIPKPAEGEALLKMLYCGICGSDMGLYKGNMGAYATFPRVPGHEIAAEIVEIGPNDYGLKKGDIVTANPYFNCGHCYSCTRGHVNCCTDNQTMGLARDGAFAEYLVMPVERLYAGKGLDPKLLALIEPFCISYHAAKRGGIRPGDNVLVVGAGTIGVFAMMAAKLMGATVCVSDVAEAKLKLAQKLGADYIIFNDDDSRFKEKADCITGGKGFDVCIEAVGLASCMMDCVNAAAHRAVVVEVGIPSKPMGFPFNVVQKKELDLRGSRNALRAEFEELIEIALSGRLNLEAMITAIYPLDEVATAFNEMDRNPGNNLKTLVKF